MTHAKIIPLRRLPKDIETFDYSVPEELQDKIRPGQLVTIPFRKSDILGLVLTINPSIRSNAPRHGGEGSAFNNADAPALKSITSIINESPLLSEVHLNLLLKLSRWYGVSLGTLALWSLPPLKKRKLRAMTLEYLETRACQFNPSPSIGESAGEVCDSAHSSTMFQPSIIYHHYANEQEHINSLSFDTSGHTLILVPLVYFIDEVYKLLTPETREQTLIWHGELSEKEQFDRWVQIRNGKKKIIIGTRSAVFLPFPKLDRIIIDYEHDENHKHWDQAPRFHVKDIAKELAHILGAELHLMSYTQSCDSYFQVAKGNWQTQPVLVRSDRLSQSEICHIIDLAAERRAGIFGMVADETKEAIRNAAADVFIYINRLGFSTSADCQKCGFVFTCNNCAFPMTYHDSNRQLSCNYCHTTAPMPKRCTKCGSQLIRLKGIGTEFVEKGVREMIKSKKENEVRVGAQLARRSPQAETGSEVPRHGGADAPAAITQSSITHSIIRIDSLSTPTIKDDNNPRILIGTHMALPFVRWDKTELIVLLGLDQQLSIPEYRASENVWQLIREIQHRSNNQDKSKIIIQTFHPDHLVFKGLNEPDRFYRTELNSRKKLGYPPYRYLVRYFYGDINQERAKKESEKFYASLKEQLTAGKIDAILTYPIEMQPRYYRGRYWYALVAKLSPDTWQEDLERMNERVPGNWKVDPNPISLLSP